MKKEPLGEIVKDWDYPVVKHSRSSGKKRLIWICPFYQKWSCMLTRCYNQTKLKITPSYTKVHVCKDWLTFSNFKSWMETQDWEGKDLDKDLLGNGELYSPETCCLVSHATNTFITESNRSKIGLPVGVKLTTNKLKLYRAYCSIEGKVLHLGVYKSPEEAHQAWLEAKREQAKILAAEQSDPRVAAALIARYENYVDPLLDSS